MDEAASTFRAQWVNPSDLFSILLIIGGDVIGVALAAVSGGSITPVTFSFGWVSYAISALLTAQSEDRLMPPAPDSSLRVINIGTGYMRFNRSWTLGRVFQNYEYWMPAEVEKRLQNHPVLYQDEEAGLADTEIPGKATATTEAYPNSRKFVSPYQARLCVSVYEWALDGPNPVAKPGYDWVYWLGIVVTVVQLGISAIPFGLHRDWSIFLVTVAGTILAYASGALPQWRKEKWACRTLERRKDVALTLGNGTQHVVVVLGAKGGLDLEDMAGGQLLDDGEARARRGRLMQLMSPGNTTRMMTFLLAVLWLMLLLTSTGIQEHAWYLLAVGGAGMLQNLITAGAPRQPAMLGVPVRLAMRPKPGNEGIPIPMVFAEFKVMHTLMELELDFKGAGRALLPEFFPGGGLQPWEEKWWSSNEPDIRRELLRAAKEKEFNKQMRRTQVG
ncbi:hypothetical protein N7491_009559 [Penicillium cf. griseofulvum]|uniref:Uncharacterized protein n=1 Tax=Penicillium cf. griseofulvum TaxID=2972120 RepID=A0A9W9MF26_9EURO|nr:hypothetical protein N7472_004847 [Penicillium cf. griseofulvum]KAJ5424343.1 hypothetical protein N7491_009559 [Penicillium cf. griseofulvum]KAJ5442415.1 hypothetical protein N7445_005422 [Penicillium cf. griseofulvum]